MRAAIRPIVAALIVLALPAPVWSQQTPVIRVATPPIDAGGQPFYARDMGFFKKAGLNVEVVTVANAWLDRNGGNYQTVKYIDMPFATMVDAVEHGRVDAAVLAEPQLDDALAKHRVRVLSYPYEAIAKEFLLGGWFANADWYKTHGEAARAYRSAMQMAGDWANKNQAESAKVLEQAIGSAVTAGGRVIYATSLDPKTIQPLIDAAAKYGALRKAFPAADLAAAS